MACSRKPRTLHAVTDAVDATQDFHESMKPLKGDIVVNGKRGLDGFPGTDLESHLVKKKIETVVLSATASG